MEPAMASDLVERSWVVVNDTVMGGVSSGQVDPGPPLRFTGDLSLEQGGGFVSIRSRDSDLGLEDALALRIHLRGDARTWDVTLRRADVPLRAGSYRVPVPVGPEGATVVVPLADFRPTAFGRPVWGLPALDRARDAITSVGFLLSASEPGPFTLEVLSIEVVGGAVPAGPGRDGVLLQLQAALAEGVPAFNRGEPERCAATYRAALTELLGHPALSPGERSVVAEALAAATGRSGSDAAWILRHALDTLAAG